MKTYNIQYNIGKARYVVNFHDGVKTHKDGSPFFDIEIFKSKKAMDSFVKKLKGNNYTSIFSKQLLEALLKDLS